MDDDLKKLHKTIDESIERLERIRNETKELVNSNTMSPEKRLEWEIGLLNLARSLDDKPHLLN